MTVLHLYAGNLYGGIERLLGTIARCRDLCPEMTPAFGLCFRGRLWDELAATGVTLFDLGAVKLSRPWMVWSARRRLREAVQKCRAEVVMTHACWPHAVFAPAVHRTGARLVTTAHDTLKGTSPIERRASQTPPELVLANSFHTAATVPTVFPGVQCEVVRYPIDVPLVPDPAATRARMRESLNTPATDTVILQASRLEKWKGAAVTIEALGQLAGVPHWTAWMAGGPQKADEHDYYAQLQARAKELGISDRLRFLGQRRDVPDLLAGADVFCQPNTGPEPFGIVFIEALAAGVPVVTSNLGGGAEVVTDACGLRTPPGDTTAVAATLRELIQNPARRASLGAAGPARAAELCDPVRQLATLATILRDGGK